MAIQSTTEHLMNASQLVRCSVFILMGVHNVPNSLINMNAFFTLIYSVEKHYNRRWKKRCEVHPGNSKWDSSHDGEHNITNHGNECRGP